MMTPASDTVSYEIVGRTGLIELNNPPVNAASHHLRHGLMQAVRALGVADGVEVIAIYGATRAFIAGADIREFGKTPVEPILPAVCLAIEASDVPVVAIMHGATLGGGLEVALSAHARVALPDLVTGFPEVTLGVIPGAGGTQRAPRLIGVAATLDLATTGRRIMADEAMELGLIDRIVDGPARYAAIAAATEVLKGSLTTRRTGEQPVTPDPDVLAETTRNLAASQSHLFAPHRAAEAVGLSTGPLDKGLARERALFNECLASPQRAGLIHAFFAERAVAKIPEADATPRDIGSLGVVGGGTMGSGIATAGLLAGLPVTLAEQDDDALDRAFGTISRNLDGAVKRGKLGSEARDALLAEDLILTTDLADFARTDLIVEAVFEDMGVKQDIFRRLDAVCKPGAVLASNTSYLDINKLAAVTQRPGDVLGLHFFSPAHVMRLLEVVVADGTAAEVTATGFALARKLRKVAVRSGVCDGFIGNRILAHYRKAADYMVVDGASPQQVDRALETFGFAMGPFAVSDLAGLDIGWATRKRLAPTRDPAERYVAVADRICERGWFGRKTGQGFYLYGKERPVPNPEIARIIEDERTKASVTPRSFEDQEIVDRYMIAMISEAARVLGDGIAQRPIDIDAVFLFGYGFPRFRGGPMHYADTIGAAALIDRIEAYAAEDAFFWQVPPLLRHLASTGQTFADLNKGA
ncbi:MAG: 3-hydroxyacyl-CoA dehydrogenase NAD-binding domain-containing protein [Rhodobacter sp.]|nr:3-hydroxyacyl-CoA dehydrogenase NAD-binding domain-containing protein [Rhodobacter sp.]